MRVKLRHAVLTTCLAFGSACLFVSTVQAAVESDRKPEILRVPDVLSVIPDDVLAVQVVKNVEQASEDLRQLVSNFRDDVDFLGLIKQLVNQGADLKGSLAIAWTPGQLDPTPRYIAFVPVSDFDSFLQPLEAAAAGEGVWNIKIGVLPLLVAKKGKYAVLVDEGEQKLLKHALTANKNLGDIVATQRLWNANQDFGVIATPHGVKWFVTMATVGINQMQAIFAGNDDPQMQQAAAAMDMYKMLVDGIGRQVKYAAFGSQFDADNTVQLHGRLVFTSGGLLSKAAADFSASKRNLLHGLAGDDYVMAMSSAFNEKVFEVMMSFSIKMMKSMPQLYGELTDKEADELAAMWKSMSSIRRMAMVFGAPRAGQTFMENTAGVMQVADTGAFMKDYAKAMGRYAKIMAGKQGLAVPEMKFDRVKIDGRDTIKFKMKMAIPEGPGAAPLEQLFGPGGAMTAFITAVDKQTIVFAYSSEDNLPQAIAAAGRPGLAKDKSLKETSDLLLPQPHAVFYVSPQGVVKMVRYFMAFGPIAPGFDLPAFPDSPPVGMAARIDQTSIEMQAVAPKAFIDALAEYVNQMKRLGPPGR